MLAGCMPKPNGGQQAADESEPLYFEPIGTGHQTTLPGTAVVELAIRDSATWAAYQDSLRPLAPFKAVDFSQAMVLLVAVPQTTSGYSVDVTSVEQTDSTIIASYVLNEPGMDCLTASVQTMPFSAVLVRRAEGPVRFVRTREEYTCTFGRRR